MRLMSLNIVHVYRVGLAQSFHVCVHFFCVLLYDIHFHNNNKAMSHSNDRPVFDIQAIEITNFNEYSTLRLGW